MEDKRPASGTWAELCNTQINNWGPYDDTQTPGESRGVETRAENTRKKTCSDEYCLPRSPGDDGRLGG